MKALREEHDAEKKLKESIVSRRTNTASLNRDIGLTASSLQEQVCMLCFRFYPLFNYASCFQIDLLNLRTGCGVVMMILRSKVSDTFTEVFIASKEARDACEAVWGSTLEVQGLRLQAFIMSGFEGMDHRFVLGA